MEEATPQGPGAPAHEASCWLGISLQGHLRYLRSPWLVSDDSGTRESLPGPREPPGDGSISLAPPRSTALRSLNEPKRLVLACPGRLAHQREAFTGGCFVERRTQRATALRGACRERHVQILSRWECELGSIYQQLACGNRATRLGLKLASRVLRSRRGAVDRASRSMSAPRLFGTAINGPSQSQKPICHCVHH